jgi:hypothetical protein
MLLAAPSQAWGATFKLDCTATSSCSIAFDGEIGRGDAKTVARLIESSRHPVQMMTANSEGGDAFEALRLSTVLNRYFVLFMAGFRNGNGERVKGTGGDCASACALVWITANQRAGTEVFVHRPTFAAAVFDRMSGRGAETAYDEEVARLAAELRRRGVPNSEVDLIMNIPSDNLQKIDSSYPTTSPWMDEWLRAKCGSEQNALIQGLGAANGRIFDPLVPVERCRADAIQQAQRTYQKKM